MESKDTDRRARGVKRVDFTTLVEICGRSGNIPAFEAEAVELSGRGMQVRTDYLPEKGAPLVLRFDAGDDEAVVEGEVAWRRENDKGGEFGIKFTALDSNSVRVLREVCAGTLKSTSKDASQPAERDERPSPNTPGTPVRLHIQGLGAPMKARVFESRAGKLHVGSQLEFLKVGRALELEQVEGGDKRTAEIDSVTVSIDPQTQIPQLIVSLCYDTDDTPGPSVVGDSDGDSKRRVEPRHRPQARDQAKDTRGASTSSRAVESDDTELDGEEDPEEDGDDLFKGRFANWASNAGSVMARGGASFAKLGAQASRGVASLLGSATQKVAEAQKDRNPRRTAQTKSTVASSAKGVTRNGQKERPRAQRSLHARSNASEQPNRKKRVAFAAVALLVCASGVYPLFIAHDEKRAPAVPAPRGQAAPLPVATAPLAVLPPAAPGTAFPAATTLDTAAQLAAGPGPVTVEVPLFGPQHLSTLEAAPLTPPPQTAIDELSMAKDQTFAQPVVPSLAKVVPSEGASPEQFAAEASTPTGATVWQAGKMHLPIVHRLRLDGAGTELQGKDTPSGFSVLVPGRKVMETGAQIAKRDDRILSVNVKNTPAGAEVVFRFRKAVPGHKVRLRNDYIEFFVNSDEQ
jgi:hypothetical protein